MTKNVLKSLIDIVEKNSFAMNIKLILTLVILLLKNIYSDRPHDNFGFKSRYNMLVHANDLPIPSLSNMQLRNP